MNVKLWTLTVAIAAVAAVPEFAGFVADRIAKFGTHLDPDGVFLWGIVHHLVQLVSVVVLMLLWPGVSMSRFGWNTAERGTTRRLLVPFCLWFLLAPLGQTVFAFVSGSTVLHFDPSPRNVAGWLGFMGLLTGPSEEALFRGFVMTVLLTAWNGRVRVMGVRLAHATILAAILFSLAHVKVHWIDLRIEHLSIGQMVIALVLGLFYGHMFERTGSLVGPIVAHSYTNVTLSGAGVLTTIIQRSVGSA